MSLPKFTSPEDLQQKITAYFESCYVAKYDEDTNRTIKVNIRPLTITGLACWLDTSRQTLLNYTDKNDIYFDTIKKAKEIIQNFAEERLFGNGQVAGVIFNMKNNWDWKDSTQTELSGQVDLPQIVITKKKRKAEIEE